MITHYSVTMAYPKNKKRWGFSRKKTKPEEEKKSLFSDVKQDTRKRFVSSLSLLLISVLTAVVFLLFLNFGGDKVLRKYNLLKKEVQEMDKFPFSGVLRYDDGIPVEGAFVGVKDVDGEPLGKTDENGFFDFSLDLPITQNYVILRFFDAEDNLLHEEKAAVMKNSTGVEQPIKYIIPTAKNVRSI